MDSAATAFFIVIDGRVKLYRIHWDRYIATAEAVSEARVGRIPADHLVRCIRDSPDIALAMIASISQHMHYLVQQVEQLKTQSGLQRVAEFLASCPWRSMVIVRSCCLMTKS